MQVTHYNNGPLPQPLAARAYLSANEFALYRADALAYLSWCQEQGLKVTGFEVWSPTVSGPISYGTATEGDAEFCAQIIAATDDLYWGNADGLNVVYNIWAAGQAVGPFPPGVT